MKIQHGTRIEFNAKVNIDPLGSYCSLCGGRTKNPLWFPLGWDGRVDVLGAFTEETIPETIWGYFPVGTECAKRFEKGILVKR
jgi:hypothetical protein